MKISIPINSAEVTGEDLVRGSHIMLSRVSFDNWSAYIVEVKLKDYRESGSLIFVPNVKPSELFKEGK